MSSGLFVLRKGDDWKLSARNRSPESTQVSTAQSGLPSAANRFRSIAAGHGSAATWLPETGYLVTSDPTEAARNFPYEEWREQALREAGRI
jgi:hypothetical protein